jgi:hypothetical protein
MSEPSDILGELADKVWEDNEEISLYENGCRRITDFPPEKAQYWLSDDMVKDVEIIRFGLFVEANVGS